MKGAQMATDEIRRKAQEAAPEASMIFLRQYVRRDDLPLPELLMEALKRLPPSGRIRRKADNTALKAVSWLLDQGPEDSALSAAIRHQYDDALARSS
jgi:hypothetical protein